MSRCFTLESVHQILSDIKSREDDWFRMRNFPVFFRSFSLLFASFHKRRSKAYFGRIIKMFAKFGAIFCIVEHRGTSVAAGRRTSVTDGRRCSLIQSCCKCTTTKLTRSSAFFPASHRYQSSAEAAAAAAGGHRSKFLSPLLIGFRFFFCLALWCRLHSAMIAWLRLRQNAHQTSAN